MRGTNNARRQQALAELQRGTDTITGLFDAKDALRAALAAVAAATADPDPLRAALEVDQLLGRVAAAVDAVRAAAIAASEFEGRKTIAAHPDSRPVLAFPRSSATMQGCLGERASDGHAGNGEHRYPLAQ